MNSFFRKKLQRKLILQSPETKTEIEFNMTDKKRLFRDVSE